MRNHSRNLDLERFVMIPTNLSSPIRAFFAAVRESDLDGLSGCFSKDALVNDQLRDFWGRGAIHDWARAEVVGERLTFLITDVREHYGEIIVTAEVDGDFDKTGLPQPTLVSLHFTTRSDAIVRLIILTNLACDAAPVVRRLV